MISENQKKRLENLSGLIYRASLKVKILRHISWPNEVKYQFFKQNCQRLPECSYPKFDSTDLDQILSDINGQLGDTKYDLWLKNKLEDISLSANLLKACGTKTFFEVSSKIYGLPTTLIHDGQTKPLDLAEQFYDIINSIDKTKLELSKSLKILMELTTPICNTLNLSAIILIGLKNICKYIMNAINIPRDISSSNI